jgi:hypothetical protein
VPQTTKRNCGRAGRSQTGQCLVSSCMALLGVGKPGADGVDGEMRVGQCVPVPVAGSERAVADPLLLQILLRPGSAKLRHARMPERVQPIFGNPQPSE